MTREEFEAFIAIEGMWIEVQLTPEKKRRKKGKELWTATISKRIRLGELSKLMESIYRKHSVPIDEERGFQATIYACEWCKTNHEAIKKIMQEYWEWEKVRNGHR